jgi:hypothetical protein
MIPKMEYSLLARFLTQKLTKTAPKTGFNPALTVIFTSQFVETRQNSSAVSGHKKTPEMAYFRGFLRICLVRSTLAELRSSTSRFEAVLPQYRVPKPLILLDF